MMPRRMSFSLLLNTLHCGISAMLLSFGSSVYKFCLKVLLQRQRCGSSIETHFGAPHFDTSVLHFFSEFFHLFAIFDVHVKSTKPSCLITTSIKLDNNHLKVYPIKDRIVSISYSWILGLTNSHGYRRTVFISPYHIDTQYLV
jgi:hypothetical protein